MDSLIEFSTVFFLVIIATIFLIPTLSNLRNKPLPPGPMGLPLIGNLNMMGQLNHVGLAKLARKYNGLFYMRIGFLDIVTISSPEAAREVLQAQDRIFSNKSATAAVRYLTYNRADMAFAHYGPFWRQIRKLSVMKLFSWKRAEFWRQSAHDEIDNLIRAISGSIGSAISLGGLIHSLNINIIFRAAFGSGSGPNDGAREEFPRLLHDLSVMFGEFSWADFIPLLGWGSPNGVSARVVEARKALDRFVDVIIDEHVDKHVEDDVVGELLRFYNVEGEEGVVGESDNLHQQIRLTRDNIKAVIVDLMFGGSGTTAALAEWAMAELLKCPSSLKRAQHELDEVVGPHQRRVEEAHLDNLPYFRCIVKETLRLHPPFPLLLHETAEEATLMGYRVPAKARVMINVWAIGRDMGSWPDPDSFKPERFLEEGVPDFKGGEDFRFIPFGSGRRACPGMNLGLHVLQMTLANVIHCFEWDLPNGHELDMDEMFGLTVTMASRLVAVPRERRGVVSPT